LTKSRRVGVIDWRTKNKIQRLIIWDDKKSNQYRSAVSEAGIRKKHTHMEYIKGNKPN
jgi:hypothetical protein